MKAKAKAKAPAKTSSKRRSTAAPRARSKRWRISDLPPELQAELNNRLEEARRGENLIPFDDAVAEAENMADEIVEILNRPLARRT